MWKVTAIPYRSGKSFTVLKKVTEAEAKAFARDHDFFWVTNRTNGDVYYVLKAEPWKG